MSRNTIAIKLSIEASVEFRNEKEEYFSNQVNDALEKKREVNDLREKLFPELKQLYEMEESYEEAKAYIELTHSSMNDDNEWISDRAKDLEVIVKKSRKRDFWGGGIEDIHGKKLFLA